MKFDLCKPRCLFALVPAALVLCVLGAPFPGQFVFPAAYAQAERSDAELVSDRKALEERAAAGDAESRGSLAYMLMSGKGGDQDLPRARTLFEEAVAANVPWARSGLAELLRKGEGGPADPQKARKIYEDLVREHDKWAGESLADMLLSGAGGPVDLPRARALFTEAASHDSILGRARLADMLRQGLGGDADEAQARHLYEELVAEGQDWVKPSLAGMLRKGQGGPADPLKARRLLSEFVSGGGLWAGSDLAQMMRSGEGGAVDRPGARALYEKMLAGGTNWVVAPLVDLIRESEGPVAGNRDALALLNVQIKKGNADAIRTLGDSCFYWDFAHPNLSCAERNYREAAARGDAYAAPAIARVLLYPTRTSYKYQEAMKLLRDFGSKTGVDGVARELATMNDNSVAVISQLFLKDSGLYKGPVNGILGRAHLKSVIRFCASSELDCPNTMLSPDYKHAMAAWIVNGKAAVVGPLRGTSG